SKLPVRAVRRTSRGRVAEAPFAVKGDARGSPVSTQSPNVVTEIAPRRSSRPVDWQELWSYREVLYILAWRDLKVRYRQTLLGAGHVISYSLFVVSGLLVWTLFASAIQGAGNSLIGSAHLISKTYFPRLLIPLAAVVVALADFCVAIVMLVPIMAWHRTLPA